MTNIINFLEQKSIAYAVLKGAHDKDSYLHESVGFKKDLDLVLNCKKMMYFLFLLRIIISNTLVIIHFWILKMIYELIYISKLLM